MPSAIPAPAPATRLSIDGATFDSGDIELTAGPGVSWTRTAGKPALLTPTGSVADAGMPPGLFVPGLLAAADPVALLENLSKSGRSYLTALELNLGTAPTGATTGANLGVKVYGSASGSQSITLAMDGTGDNAGKHYALNAGVGASLGGVNGAQNGGYTGGAVYTRIRTTAAMTVGALALGVITGPDGGGYGKVYEITDVNGVVLAASAPYFGPIDVPVAGGVHPSLSFPVSFTSSVNLAANTEYYVGCRLVNDVWSGNPNVGPTINLCQVTGPAYTGNCVAPLSPNFAEIWVYNQTGSIPPPFSKTTYTGHTALAAGDAFALLGGSRGALIVGTVKVALVAAGVGPTTPGNDLNIRLGWQQSA